MEPRLLPRKLIERTIRMLPVILVLTLVTPALVIAQFPKTGMYESTSTIWVSNADEFSGTTLGEENVFDTPASRQAGVIEQLLDTDQFALAIVRSAGLVAGDAGVAESRVAMDWIRRHLEVYAAGTNLLGVTAEDPDPRTAQAITAATVDEYLARVVQETERRTQIQIDFYRGRLSEAELILNERRIALAGYLADQATVEQADLLDPEYQSLSAAFAAQQAVVTGLQTALQDAQLDALTAQPGTAARYAVQDSASLPTALAEDGRLQTLGLPVAAAAVAFGVAIAWTFVASRADHTVRSSEDLHELEVPVVGFIPEVRQRRPLTERWRFGLGRDRHFVRHLASSVADHGEA